MYQRAQGIALKACVPETFHHHTTSAATSYLDALNFIAASDGKVSWIAYSSNPEGLASSTNSSIPESEFTSAHQSPELVTVSDIKLKYHLTLCRLQLAEHYPELMSSGTSSLKKFGRHVAADYEIISCAACSRRRSDVASAVR